MPSTPNLDTISEEKLLELPIKDLPVQIEGTWLEKCVNELHKELKDRGLLFKPKCYLADEWLTPDLEPVVGIPFFLAHPALIKLEKKMMVEAEGSTVEWCMKLLRHEAGHAINYAFNLYKRRKWREVFGSFKTEYKDIYRFRPYSRNFVRHLEDYYAQYHPDEDFAETFAVWLTPKSDWKERYKKWPAIHKLNYIDQVMDSIKNKEPAVKKGEQHWKVSRVRKTLKNYYKHKRHFHAEDFPDFHDTNLKKIFTIKEDEKDKGLPAASKTIRKYRKYILESTGNWTGEKKYIANDLINKLIKRSTDLKLVCEENEAVTMLRVATYVSALLMNYLYTGRFRGEKWRKK